MLYYFYFTQVLAGRNSLSDSKQLAMQNSTRQLAAIMFTDMVGYTALMQADEKKARENQVRHKKVFDASVAAFNGKVLMYYGDGTLSIFSSTLECVQCAISIQQQLLQPPKVDLRIGIHTGDVTLEEDGIYGDGVNIASRIETLAVPGGIFISEKVLDDIRNQTDILTSEVGYFELKNVQEPVHVFAIANEGLVIPSHNEIKGKTKQPVNSLAVLPFINLSGDPENEYFSDGITEELLNALTAVEGLRVTSRTSSFAMKGLSLDIRDIAARLNVDKLLEGSVRKAGNRVRITAQLINAADGFHIWSETYDRDLTNIFQVQDDISRIIANKLRAKLSLAQKEESLVKTATQNLEAYALFLKGKFFNNKETPAEMFQAIAFYKQAIALEPDFALPYAMMAGAYAMLGSVGVIPGMEAYLQIVEASNRALQLDPSLSQGHVARGIAYLFFEWNWKEAYRSFMKAIELNPGAMEAYWVLGYYYLVMDDSQKAVDAFEKAWQHDPLSMSVARSLGIAYFYERRYDDVIRLSNMQLDVIPGNWYALSIKGFCFGLKGNWELALDTMQQAYDISDNSPLALSYVAYCNGKLGKKEAAQAIINQLEDFHRLHPELAKYADLCLAWFGLGDMDKVFDNLSKSVERHEEMISYMVNSPVYEGLKNDVRFNDIKKKMNL